MVASVDWRATMGGMATTTVRFPDHTFEMRRDVIEVTSFALQPDPDWKHTDSNGHQHARETGSYEWVVTGVSYTYDGDEMDEGEYRCTICAEVVVPGTLPPSPYAEYIAGPTDYLIDGVEVTEAVFRAAYEAARQTL